MTSLLSDVRFWRKRNRWCQASYILALFLILCVALNNQRVTFKGRELTHSFAISSTSLNELHPDVNVMTSLPPAVKNLPPHLCIRLPEHPKVGARICVHPVESDRAVSKALVGNKLWEKDLVLEMEKVLRRNPKTMLLDVGCNVGVYSLWAALMGHRVVAVDMLPGNLHLLQMSLFLNQIPEKVTLINNGVFRDHRTLETVFVNKSMGSTHLNTTKKKSIVEDRSKSRIQVRTICLNDLAPLLENQNVYMKMDIENAEHHALACAEELFRRVNIRVVQMEWHRKTPDESVPILSFMKANGYVASLSSIQYKPVDLRNLQKGIDVFFLKKSEYKIH